MPEIQRTVIRPEYPQPSLCFYNSVTQKVQQDIWVELEQGLWQDYKIDNRLYNDALGETNQSKWKPVFENIYPVYPGFKIIDGQKIEDCFYDPKVTTKADKSSFYDAASKFLNRFYGEKIGVHLSGGLDSSLIICILKMLGIPFYLVGLQSNRYEFRTEKIIQNILAPLGIETVLLDMDEYPFYSDLLLTPKHQIPDSNIKVNKAHQAVADEFKRMRVTVVFTGQGGDTLLTEDMTKHKLKRFNIRNEFTFPWDEDLIYSPRGIKLISFFSCTDIIDQICSLRQNMKEDVQKWWARNFFKDILPRELSEYAYCADFFGHSMSGLEAAKQDIKLLFEESYELTGHPIFSPSQTDRMLETDVFSFEYKDYCEFCTKISIAVWYHSLFRKV